MDGVTLGIKTFNRPSCLKRLLDSIRQYYPEVPIIIADDGSDQLDTNPFFPITHLELPFDSGITVGRNAIINRVITRYYVTLDDDFVFTKDTKLETFKDILDTNENIDIVSGLCMKDGTTPQRYNGTLDIIDNKLVLDQNSNRGTINGYTKYDITLYFFMGRTRKIQKVGWDEDIKMAPEHLDFFFRGKDFFNVIQIDDVKVDHIRYKPTGYAPFRARTFDDIYCRKHNLSGIIRG